ncbi:tetratricopeptide repeat protein [Streptomyces sp. NPDC048109]|uniref:tetratricopeptide repeat protein n=1 Tax=Streptomyces sp. NPDC048109 TaxID=3155482 RepID=UPI0034361352
MLPPRPIGFTGRSAELERLLPHLSPDEDDTTALPLLIFAVTGMGGVGKTALALEAAHRARAQDWFPGGTLFVDLRGYDDDPVTADQAVLALLDALGVRDGDLPPTADRQYDAYRALLAERRERMLLILDNTSDPTQYLPLLPGTDHHRVLITSRDRPDALPVRLIDLEALSPNDSATLLTRALHDTDERDDRPTREPDALHELTCLCGHLPLALQVAAGMLRRRRHRDIASLVAEIRDAGDPTTVLDRGSPGTDLYGRSLVLRPVLATSYQRLPLSQARLLRLLCLTPGAESGVEVIAALADLDAESTLSALDDLAARCLVTAVRDNKGTASAIRWRLHDLVRSFGAGVVATDTGFREEGEAARERVLNFYTRWADAADDRLRWLPGMNEPERFVNREQALAWLDAERAGLVAAVGWGREKRFAGTALRLALCLGEYLAWRRYFDDAMAVAEDAREAAGLVGNPLGEAIAWNNLGSALREAGHPEKAIDAHTRAINLFETGGDRHHEASAWNNLGNALWMAGQAEKAIDAHTRAIDLYEDSGDRHDKAMAWNNLGVALLDAGQAARAITAHTRAIDLYRDAGDRHHEAFAWNNLGSALQKAGRTEDAIGAYSNSLELHHGFDDWFGRGQTLHNLAVILRNGLRSAEARAAWLEASDAFTRAEAPTQAAQARAHAAELPE